VFLRFYLSLLRHVRRLLVRRRLSCLATLHATLLAELKVLLFIFHHSLGGLTAKIALLEAACLFAQVSYETATLLDVCGVKGDPIRPDK
jgi:hypothetical protein